MGDNHHALTITVVVPVYYVAFYIKRCIMSVMKQSLPAAECIIVDDASPDDSIDRCQRLIAQYNGPTIFRILHHEKNRGLSAARNTGIDAATGKYVLFLDGDDELTEDCIERLVCPVLKDETIEMVLGGFRANYSAKTGKRNVKDHDVLFVKDELLELSTNADIRRWYYSQ